MRLLNVNAQKAELVEFFGDKIPPYAILSHTWGDDEVTFQDLQSGSYEHKLGFRKIHLTCQQARRDRLSWCWVDTCCIDKSSSAELSEAINSMFNWYSRAQVCYAYLADVCTGVRRDSRDETPSQDQGIVEVYEEVRLDLRLGNQLHIEQRHWYDTQLHSPTTTTRATFDSREHGTLSTDTTTYRAFGDSRWFQRGWTLQELIAPRRLKFFGRSWEPLGERDEELLHAVVECTGLSPIVFGNTRALQHTPIAQRMSWMARRKTTRKEDEAYCLLGIFGVHMPLLYGEADMAFVRLQEELVRRFRDHSLLIFSDLTRNTSILREPLAASSRDFAGCKNVEACNTYKIPFALESYHLTSDAIHINLPLIRMERARWARDLALLGYTNHGAPIALVLVRAYTKDAEETWLTCDYESHHFGTQDVVATPSLGSGIVTIPEELAITARREMILIARDVQHRKAHVFHHQARDQASDDAWVRYDLALKYESGMPGLNLESTVARQRRAGTPHMIRVKRLFSFPVTQFVLKFSLEDFQDTAIVVALIRMVPENDIRGALLLTQNSYVESEKHLSVVGTGLLDKTLAEGYRNQSKRTDRLARVPVEGVGMLELWRDGFVGDWNLGHGRVTLRISGDGPCKRRLSDGTEE
ncbi:hypothetical protein Q7P35_009682 [Cladosporium inversicolor]